VGAEPPAGPVVLAAFVAVLVAAAIEIVLRDAVGMIVGVVLVLASITVALTIRASDLFTAGVLPPLLLVAALGVVAVVHPAGINVSRLQPDAGVAQTVIAGFVALARWLVAAHAVALVLVALRLRVSQARAATRRRVASA
jgi:hypothetical protein